MAQKRSWRRVDGVLLLDKSAGLSSNQALQQARRLFQAEKAGHLGTLDPFASGLLPIALGEATKLSQFSLDANKTYRATMRLGVTTTTGDPEGEEVVRCAPQELERITKHDVESALLAFIGKQEQMPPRFSALKYQGKAYYDYARAGIDIPRETRTIEIFSLSLVDFSSPTVVFDTQVSKGTYIRTLAEDIGSALGCGAHLTALRRLQSGSFTLEQAYTLDALTSLNETEHMGALLSPDALLAGQRRIDVDQDVKQRLLQGQRINLREVGLPLDTEFSVCAAYCEDVLIGIASASDGALRPKRLFRYSSSDGGNQ